ncbi:MAG: hypothetical protein HQK52_17970 [Oligoflexia bacterium]|nr:hypothetical protein [Oligoflexia bacterium]
MERKKKILILSSLYLLSFFVTSCGMLSLFKRDNSNGSGKGGSVDIKQEKITYQYHDGSGDYRLIKESGKVKSKNLYYVKSRILSEESGESEEALLEKSLTIASKSKLNRRQKQKLASKGGAQESVSILRPLVSQYTVWLEGKKYFSQFKVDAQKQIMEIFSITPENKKGQKQTLHLPKGNGIYCFFSQVPECIKVTGFLNMAKEKRAGNMSFYLIWDGYPHYQHLYENFNEDAYSMASFNYDGIADDGTIRYELKTEREQSIFFHFNKDNDLIKKLWVARGVGQEREDYSKSSKAEKDGDGGDGEQATSNEEDDDLGFEG